MIGVITQEAIDRQNAAAKGYRPYLGTGHAADSPSNEPGRARESGPGEIAAAHHLGDGPHGVPGLDAQPHHVRMPWQARVTGEGPVASEIRSQRPAAQDASMESVTVLTDSAAGAPAGSSYRDHAGRAVVEHMDAAAAAAPGLAGQLGPRAPGGVPLLGPERVAPTGVNARFRVSPPQAATAGGAVYLPARGAF